MAGNTADGGSRVPMGTLETGAARVDIMDNGESQTPNKNTKQEEEMDDFDVEAAEEGCEPNGSDSINDGSNPKEEGDNQVQSGPEVELANPVVVIRTIDVGKNQLRKFEALPDYLSGSDLPIPVAVKRDGIYWVIGGSEKVEAGDGSEETIRVLEFVLADTSDFSIAIEKMAYMDRPLGGSASFAEKVWLTAHLIPLVTSDPKVKVLSGHGGARKGAAYSGAAFLPKLIAARLRKPESVAKNYVFYGRYVDRETLKMLAEKRLDKRFFESVQTRKTGLLASLKDRDDAAKTEQVSRHIVEWLRSHEAEEAEKAAKAVEAAEKAKTARAAKALEKKQKATTPKKGEDEKPAETRAAIEANDPSSVADGGEASEETLDAVVEEAPEVQTVKNDGLETATPEASGSLPESPTANVYRFLKDRPAELGDLLGKVLEVGNRLVKIGEAKPSMHDLTMTLKAAIGDLNGILTALAEDQDQLTATTRPKAA